MSCTNINYNTCNNRSNLPCFPKNNSYCSNSNCNTICSKELYYNFLKKYNANKNTSSIIDISKSGASGTLDTICDGSTEHVVYDYWFPLPFTLTLLNRGDCPVEGYIYYTDGFYIKRESRQVNPNDVWTSDPVLSVIKVSILCDSVGVNCPRCNYNNAANHCLVDYIVI